TQTFPSFSGHVSPHLCFYVDFSLPCFFLGLYVVGSFWASLLIYSVTVATVLMFLVVLVGIQL
ncbi:hypothetical protein GGU10DRAFT_367289, partial [Lentinula aff. detonsa]